MSGPAIHHLIALKNLDNLKRRMQSAADSAFFARIETGDFGAPYFLGSQGPDFLFFNPSDWPPGVGDLVKTYMDVQDFMNTLSERIQALVPDRLKDLAREIDNKLEDAEAELDRRSAIYSQIKDLLEIVKADLVLIKQDVGLKLEAWVTCSDLLFDQFKHPQQDGQRYGDWWWFDTLHIRRTGQFLSAMMKLSDPGSMERAYAHGFLTHYAADVVGHPFVNIIAGGPYRTHPHRHKVVENHQDVWAFNQYGLGEFTTSDLASKYVINGQSDTLPSSLSRFIHTCIQKVYRLGQEPAFCKDISEQDINKAFELWFTWFKGVTNDFGPPPPEPYAFTAEVAEVWDKFVQNCGDILDLVGEPHSGGFSLAGFLRGLAALIAAPVLLGLAIADFLIGILETLATAPLMYFLSLLYESLYGSYLNLRKAVVLNGFKFPRISDLQDPIVTHMMYSKATDDYGHNASSLPNQGAYPAKKFKPRDDAGRVIDEAHLFYPWPDPAAAEKDPCIGAPIDYLATDATWYIDSPENKFMPAQFVFFNQFDEAGQGVPVTPQTVNDNFSTFRAYAMKGGLGNALAFSDALLGSCYGAEATAQFPDFSMDSDRGYAYKSWRKVSRITLLNSAVTDYSQVNVPVSLDDLVPNPQCDMLASGSVL